VLARAAAAVKTGPGKAALTTCHCAYWVATAGFGLAGSID
jgi:hypothetical protein